MPYKTLELSRHEADTLVSALRCAREGKTLTEEEREVLQRVELAFQRHDVLIKATDGD